MYESFFGLRRRPFSPLPRVDSFVSLAPFREPLSELIRCIEQDQGIGVLTGPAGSGKSLLCRMLYQHFSDSQRAVLLTTGRFPTRRALLQAILFELKHPFVGLSEQEARLTVLDMLEASPPPSDRMLLIVDEAHLLSARGLEELRTLSDYEAGEKRRVSLILAGQLELEEHLTGASLNALNQRVGCHVCLEALTLEESYQYIRDRLAMAGSNGLLAFTPEAIHLIATASEGNPRRLNQLCDHSLLLAFAEEERPVDVATVRSALLDLRELPLHWNTPIDLSEPRECNPLDAVSREHQSQHDDDEQADVETFWKNNQAEIAVEADHTLPASGPECPLDVDQPESGEQTAFVYEVGATTDDSPFDQLFQVRKFVVPAALRDPESDPIQSIFAPDSRGEFETAALSNSQISEPPHSMDRDEKMSDHSCPDNSDAAAPIEVFETGMAPQYALPKEQTMCDFDELIVDDNYAHIDRLMEASVDTTALRRPHVPCVAVHSPCELMRVESSCSVDIAQDDSVQVESIKSDTVEDDAPSRFDQSEMASVHAVDETQVIEQHPVFMESQILQLVQEIDTDVRSFRREIEAREQSGTTSKDSTLTHVATDSPPHYSLRQTLNWQFDVVEPEKICESQDDERRFESQTPGSPSDQQETVRPDEVTNRAELEVPPVAKNTEPSAQQPTERRYAQLFTRLQRQRRRVESVINKERRSGSETHLS